MNNRNQELIVDLLGGQLSPTEERSLLSQIESEPALRSEYEAQMSVISILDASPVTAMTAEERSTLHAALRQQLYLDDSPAPVVAAPSRWQRWLAPIGGLAVAAAVVVGAIVVLPGALSTDDSDGSFEVAFAEITTTAASSSATDALSGEIETQSADDGGDGVTAPDVDESGLAGGAVSDEETQAAETFDAAVAPLALPYLADIDLGILESDLASDPESLRNSTSPTPSKSSGFGDAQVAQVDDCLDSLRTGDSASFFSPIAMTTYEGIPAVVISISPSEGDPFLAVFSLDLCREITSTQR